MEDIIRENQVFDMTPFSEINTASMDHVHSKRLPCINVNDYDHHASLDSIDALGRELKDLHEKLLKMRVRAHMLEVDIATQFNPETLLEIRQVDIKCQECEKAAQDMEATVDSFIKDTHQNNLIVDIRNQ